MLTIAKLSDSFKRGDEGAGGVSSSEEQEKLNKQNNKHTHPRAGLLKKKMDFLLQKFEVNDSHSDY